MTTNTIYFHIDITISVYFLRGYDLRTHITIPYNIIIKYVSILITITNRIMMPKYSPRKNLTNSPLENSVLKPDTSSDSLSIRSIGVRPTSHDKMKYITPTTTIIFGVTNKMSSSTISYLHASTIKRNPPIFEYELSDSIILFRSSNINDNINTIII